MPKVQHEYVEMPWQGLGEPSEHSSIYDAHEHVLLTDPLVTDPPTAADGSEPRWRICVTWEQSDDAWRPVSVGIRSVSGQPVNLTIWRAAPISRAIRWSQALLTAKGLLASQTALPEVAEQLRSRILTSHAPTDQRVYFDTDHWARVEQARREAQTGARGTLRRVAELLESHYPDVADAKGRPIYRGLSRPGDTRVKGWLQRLTQLEKNNTKGGEQE